MALQGVTRSAQKPRIDSQHKRPRSGKRICPLDALFQQPARRLRKSLIGKRSAWRCSAILWRC